MPTIAARTILRDEHRNQYLAGLNAAGISGNVNQFDELVQKRLKAALEDRPVEKPAYKI